MTGKDTFGKEEHKYLTYKFGGKTKEIFQDELKNVKATTDQRYTAEMKQFAVTLHYYLPKLMILFAISLCSSMCMKHKELNSFS